MLNLTASLPDQNKDLSPHITVIGVGGAGCNAVNNMIASKLEGVQFVSCNTDAQALQHSLSPSRLQLGGRITAGLGAGSKPDMGRAAAEESIDDVMNEIAGAHMVFITAGMGGGTGTGAAPVIARACKEAGILTVGVVTKPFHFEGAHRMRMAEAGLQEMQEYVDTLIVIPNQNLFRIANEKTTFAEAFKLADSVLQSGVRGVTDLMVMPGLINLDFADIRSAMMEMGKAMMGTGEAGGDRRAIEAAERAINNPLLDDISMKGAKGVIINITGGYDMTLFEVDEACNRIRDEVDADANIIFGSTFDDNLEGVMRVTVLATGIETEAARRARPIRTGTGATTMQIQNVAHHQEMQQPLQPQMRTERAQPGTQVGALDGMYGSATGFQQQLVVPSPSARVSSPQFAPQQQFAQQQFAPAAATYQQPELAMPQYAQQQQQAAAVASAADLSRGVRYGGAFIPPRPVDPEGSRPHASQPGIVQQSAVPQQQAQHQVMTMGAAAMAIQPQAYAQQMQPAVYPEDMRMPQPQAQDRPSALHLNPPVPGSRGKKRGASLFDKLAGMFSENDDDLGAAGSGDAGQGGGQQGGGQGGGLFASFSARRPMPELPAQPMAEPQPALRPQQQQQAQPAQSAQQADLEIPAFLRRQVS